MDLNMAFQPRDEQNDLQHTYEYTRLETAQYSQNSVPSPITAVNFSSISNIFDDLSSYIKDPNDAEGNSLLLFDEVDRIDKIMNDAQCKLGNMSSDAVVDQLMKELDVMELKNIDQSIEDRSMSVKIQPPTDIRRRYESDGKRQIENSRSKPMAIQLPNLKTCQLNSDQSLWLQLYLITTNENPSKKIYLHPYKLEYHEDGLPECDSGFVRVPLTQQDIQNGIKQLARISIIKKKLDAYTFELIPFGPLSTDNEVEIYENQNAKSIVAKAKCYRDAYNLQSSRIACQLLIKQYETWYMTDIVCQTNTMEEKEKKSDKRSASSDINEYELQHQSSAKKPKRSSPLVKGLPITRVNKS